MPDENAPTAVQPDPVETTPFELNIAEQPDALRRLAAADADFGGLPGRTWGRIVLTGMGSSHFAAQTTWHHLVGAGLPAWAVDSGWLLDNPALLTDDTLLVVTSQSGATGEVVQLLERRAAGALPRVPVLGVTDDLDSPLAAAADAVVGLRSGPEGTVSTKSYVNSIGAHRLLRAAFAGESIAAAREELLEAAEVIGQIIDTVDLSASAGLTAAHPQRRLAYVGAGGSAGTALFSALITKESTKVAAEGYVGGQFRHGPYELAGEGLTAVILAPAPGASGSSLGLLAADLVGTGAHVVVVGDPSATATVSVPVPATTDLALAAGSAAVSELFAVDLARANGVVPGAFLFGDKVTTIL